MGATGARGKMRLANRDLIPRPNKMPLFQRAPKPQQRWDGPARTGLNEVDPLELAYWGRGERPVGKEAESVDFVIHSGAGECGDQCGRGGEGGARRHARLRAHP